MKQYKNKIWRGASQLEERGMDLQTPSLSNLLTRKSPPNSILKSQGYILEPLPWLARIRNKWESENVESQERVICFQVLWVWFVLNEVKGSKGEGEVGHEFPRDVAKKFERGQTKDEGKSRELREEWKNKSAGKQGFPIMTILTQYKQSQRPKKKFIMRIEMLLSNSLEEQGKGEILTDTKKRLRASNLSRRRRAKSKKWFKDSLSSFLDVSRRKDTFWRTPVFMRISVDSNSELWESGDWPHWFKYKIVLKVLEIRDGDSWKDKHL